MTLLIFTVSAAAAIVFALAWPKAEPEAPLPDLPDSRSEVVADLSVPADQPDTVGAVARRPPEFGSLLEPGALTETAPEYYVVTFVTTEGDFQIEVIREWAPLGADRFYNLVKAGYYRDIAVFRVISGFMAQFGIHGEPAVNKVWRFADLVDDPWVETVSNVRGTISFAKTGRPNSRASQLFINYGNNVVLDHHGFTPFGRVMGDGMSVVDEWHAGYGEGIPRGKGPSQGRMQELGNAYVSDFPELSRIKSITLVAD